MMHRRPRLAYVLALVVTIFVVSTVAVSADPVWGDPPSGRPPAAPPVVLPEQAVEVAPGVYYLGKALDHGRVVEGYAFVHYRQSPAKPVKPPKPSPDTSCYEYLGSGVRWKTVEPWVVSGAGTAGLTASVVLEVTTRAIARWEVAAGKNILGEGSSGTVSPGTFNYKNELAFADIADSNVIAIAYVWGYFGGRPSARELVEWDQVYDDVDYTWALCNGTEDCPLGSKVMDFANIATHELGHSVGMGDLYTSACSEQTMYGYADYGETKKQSLESGDIAGVKALYK